MRGLCLLHADIAFVIPRLAYDVIVVYELVPVTVLWCQRLYY